MQTVSTHEMFCALNIHSTVRKSNNMKACLILIRSFDYLIWFLGFHNYGSHKLSERTVVFHTEIVAFYKRNVIYAHHEGIRVNGGVVPHILNHGVNDGERTDSRLSHHFVPRQRAPSTNCMLSVCNN
jgi:hypothetical protein